MNATRDYQRLEEAVATAFDEHPDWKRPDVFSHIAFGWRARTRAARVALDRDDDANIIREIITQLEKDVSHLNTLRFRDWAADRYQKRRIAALTRTWRDAGLDPDDAPLYQRIGNQRREIKRLQRENDRLRGELARVSEG